MTRPDIDAIIGPCETCGAGALSRVQSALSGECIHCGLARASAAQRAEGAAAERARCVAEMKMHAATQRRVAVEKRAEDAPCSADAHEDLAVAFERAALLLEIGAKDPTDG